MSQLVPLNEGLIKARLQLVDEAVKGSHRVFLVSAVASFMVIAAVYNTYVCWSRVTQVWKMNLSQNLATQEAQKKEIQTWMESQFLTISLLGTKIDSADLSPLASFVLFGLSFWFYASMRRENNNITDLLRWTAGADSALRYLVFWGIADRLLFNPLVLVSSLTATQIENQPRADRLSQFTLRFLTALPAIASGSILLSDFLGPLFESPFSDSYLTWSRASWTQFSVVEPIAIALFVGTIRYCRRVGEMEQETRRLVAAYGEALADPSIAV